MEPFFCAKYSRELNEEIIGSASNHKIYILVECPTPWMEDAFDSKSIPENLKKLVFDIKKENIGARFLLIYNKLYQKENITKVIIYKIQQEGITDGYLRAEFDLQNINEAAPTIREFLSSNIQNVQLTKNPTRDILVCTHGSHDKCCAKYGNPFYRKALFSVSSLSLNNIRIWQASHFGGHRFAPTIIDFPEGRYYGVLDENSFISILTKKGNICCFNKVYRGWSILPNLVQILEKELILLHGWDWLNYKVSGKITRQNDDKTFSIVELSFKKPDGTFGIYQAEIELDKNKTLYTKGACSSPKESVFLKYAVKNINII